MLWHDFLVGNMQLLARIVEYIFIHVHYVDAHYIQQPSLLILTYSSSSLSPSPLSPQRNPVGSLYYQPDPNLGISWISYSRQKWEPQNCHRFDRFVFFDSPITGSIFHDPNDPWNLLYPAMVSNLLTSKVDPRVRPNGCRAAKCDAFHTNGSRSRMGR